MNLASGLAIPVAKNINAQAKVLEVSDDDDISDVIDGNDIAVDTTSRRSAGGSKSATEDTEISAAVAAIETDDKIKNDLDADGVPDDQQEPKKSPKKKIKVPNVNSLRKKILIGGGLAVVLIGFLVWAIVFAPSATITIQAKTSAVEVKKSLSLVPSGDKDAAEGVLPPVVKQKKTLRFSCMKMKMVFIRFILKEFLILMKAPMFINFKWIQLVQAKIVI